MARQRNANGHHHEPRDGRQSSDHLRSHEPRRARRFGFLARCWFKGKPAGHPPIFERPPKKPTSVVLFLLLGFRFALPKRLASKTAEKKQLNGHVFQGTLKDGDFPADLINPKCLCKEKLCPEAREINCLETST